MLHYILEHYLRYATVNLVFLVFFIEVVVCSGVPFIVLLFSKYTTVEHVLND